MKIKVKIPTTCPSCDTSLNRIKDQIFCTNKDCSASILKKIVAYAKVLKIKGLGEKTIEKLALTSIPSIYTLSLEYITNAVGEKLATKLIVEIEKSKHTSLAILLASFSIPLIGTTAGNKIAKHTTSIYNVNKEVCKLAGLGEKATASLLSWLIDNKSLYDNIPVQTSIVTADNSVATKVVCISGKLSSFPSKAKATEFLNSLGYSLVSGMSKKVDYLINEDNKDSSKVKLARKYDIEIVTIEELKGK